MNILDITVDNAAELLNTSAFGAGALLRVESSSTMAGTYSEVGTTALVAGTRVYTVYHAAGTAGTYYRTRYSTASPSTAAHYSSYSWPFQASPTPDAYASADMLRQHVRASAATDAADDDASLVLLALEAGARAIDRACGRDFRVAGTEVSTRYFTLESATRPVYSYTGIYFDRHAIVPIDDVFDATGMVVKFDVTGNGDADTTVTAYRLGPSNAAARLLPYSQLVFDTGTYPPPTPAGVQVDALWGWGQTPGTIVQANLIQAARFLKRRDAAFGIAGSPEMGNEMRLLARLDPDVALMVSAYKRNWGAV